MRAGHLLFLGQIEWRLFAKDHEKGQKSDGNSDGLGHRKEVREGPTAGVSAIEFDDKTGTRIKEKVIPEKLTLEPFRPAHDDQSQEDPESCGRFIKLRRMKGNPQRGQGVGVAEGDGAKPCRRLPIAAARRKTSQPTQSLTDGNGWGS